jgi:DNA-binding transcriptional LysR family regulator
LIDRSHRPLALTAPGRVLQRHARPIIEDAESLTARVRQAGSSKLPELRIGVLDSFAATAGPGVIRALLKTTLKLSFRSGLAQDQGEALLTRNLDVIITSDAMADVDGLDRHRVLTEPFLLLMPDRMARAESSPELKRLAATYSLIRFSQRSYIGTQIERHLRRLGVRAPHLLEVDATDALTAMVAAGLGWAIATPLCMLQVRSRLEGITAVPFPGPAFVRQLYVITRAGEYEELAQTITRVACGVLREQCLPELKELVPWTSKELVIG